MASLGTIRQSSAWVMNTGINLPEEFRAVRSTNPTPIPHLSRMTRFGISLGPAFINSTTQSDGEWMLFSIRPPKERPGWVAIERRHPHVVYIAPEEVVINTPQNTTPGPAITPPCDRRNARQSRESNHDGTQAGCAVGGS